MIIYSYQAWSAKILDNNPIMKAMNEQSSAYFLCLRKAEASFKISLHEETPF